MRILIALTGLCLASVAWAAEKLPVFNAVLTMNGQHRFVLTNEAGASSKWLTIGDAYEGHVIKAFDVKTNTLELEKGGLVQKVKLVEAAVGEGVSATPATLADAEAALQSMRFDEMMAKMAAQQKEAMRPIFQQQAARMRIPEEHRARFAELQSRIMDETLGVMAGPEMRAAITQLYSEVFTKEELSAMSAFHATPAGQALIDKQPAVQQRMMQIMMSKMSEIGPRMERMTREFQASLPKPEQPASPPANPSAP